MGIFSGGENYSYIIGVWHRNAGGSIFRKKALKHFWSMRSSVSMGILPPLHLKLSNLYECITRRITALVMLPDF